jgi:hypothetical protein
MIFGSLMSSVSLYFWIKKYINDRIDEEENRIAKLVEEEEKIWNDYTKLKWDIEIEKAKNKHKSHWEKDNEVK